MNSTPINPATNGEGFTLAAQGRAKKRVQDERGTTLVEVVIAGTILAIALSGLYTLLGATVNEVKRGHTASGAQQNTVTRLDQIRSLTWASITNAQRCGNVLKNDEFHRILPRAYREKWSLSLRSPSPKVHHCHHRLRRPHQRLVQAFP